LEIQDIQTQLLSSLVSTQIEPKGRKYHPVWTAEISSDEFTRMLLRYSRNEPLATDGFIFSHWHEVYLRYNVGW
jgi:hypothetical protein